MKLIRLFIVLALLLTALPAVPPARAEGLYLDKVSIEPLPEDPATGTARVKLSWFTNALANGRVDFGTTTSYGSYIGASEYKTYQEVTLTALKSLTTYYFKITATGLDGEQVQSFGQTFKTVKVESTTAPTTYEIRVRHFGTTYFVVTWLTNEPSSSTVDFSLNADMSRAGRATGARDTTLHEVVVKGLASPATYYYRVKSSDKDGNEGISATQIFTTPAYGIDPDDALTITRISPVSSPDPAISDTTVTISWRTSRPSRGRVDFSTKAKGAKGGRVNQSGYYETENTITLINLKPSTILG